MASLYDPCPCLSCRAALTERYRRELDMLQRECDFGVRYAVQCQPFPPEPIVWDATLATRLVEWGQSMPKTAIYEFPSVIPREARTLTFPVKQGGELTGQYQPWSEVDE